MKTLASTLHATAMTALAFCVPAHAADIYAGGGGYKDPGYAELWNGPYFGIHGGGAWSNVTVKDADNYSGSGPNSWRNDGSGAFGGGTWGWNWQFGRCVTSAEFDLGVLDVSHRSPDPVAPAIYAKQDYGFYGDATLRAGYTFDRTLLYVKGGFGWFNGSSTVVDPGVDQTFKTQSYTGWTAGGGIEYKVTPNWSVKVEYLHFDFGDEEAKFVAAGTLTINSASLATVKAGVNYEIVNSYTPLK